MTENNSALLHLAVKANRLGSRLSRESELHRIAGRLIGAPHDLDALARSTVYEVKADGCVLPDHLKTGTGFLLLQFAIARVSNLCWEDLWDDTHPDRFGQAWEGEDFDLMSIWREKVGAITNFCFFHDPSKGAERHDAHSAGGRQNRMRTLDTATPDVEIKNCGDVVALLSETINQVRKGLIDPRVANSVGYLANQVVRVLAQDELENRIEKLEQVIARRSNIPDLTLKGLTNAKAANSQTVGQD